MDVFKFTTNRKSSGGGMQGGTRNCPGFLCKQKSVSRNLPPVANRARSNGEALVAKGEMHKAGQAILQRRTSRRSRGLLHYLHVLHGEVYLFFFVNFRAFRG